MTTEITIRGVPVSGGRLTVARRGVDGPTLVFVNYWGGSSRTWDYVVELLPPSRDVVRYDQRGWGSARMLPGPYHLEQLADDLLAVVAALELERYVLVGHSMGGKVSQLAAARHPLGLAALVLVAPAPPRPGEQQVTDEFRRALSHAYDSSEQIDHALTYVLTASRLDEQVRARVRKDSLDSGTDARVSWPLYGVAEDISALAERIVAPVLVLSGELDRVEPPESLSRLLLPHVTQARLEVVPGCGHLLPLEAPEAVASAVEAFAGGLSR